MSKQTKAEKMADDPMPWVHLLCRELVKVETLFQQLEREGIIGRKESI